MCHKGSSKVVPDWGRHKRHKRRAVGGMCANVKWNGLIDTQIHPKTEMSSGHRLKSENIHRNIFSLTSAEK